MYSAKNSVLQTVALLKQYGIKHVVCSPGSRNAPLLQSFSQDSFFKCHVIVDERNAAFYAIGVIQALKEPVAVCCTSGTALLNYAPAVAEAFYQQLPLIVISADRTPERIGQMDGQTLPQAGVFNSLVKKSVNIPENDDMFANRLVNEALIAATANTPGPVHINIPLSEPLFDYSIKELPEVRKINYPKIEKIIDIKPYADKWRSFSKRLIIVGQYFQSSELTDILNKLVSNHNCVVFVEHLSNCVSPQFIGNFDAILGTINDDEIKGFAPDLVITLGGHIVSKRLKNFLHQNKPGNHWHINLSGELVDLFQSLTDLIEADSVLFLQRLEREIKTEIEKPFYASWKNQLVEPSINISYDEIHVTGEFLKCIPKNSILHLANSSAVRNAQLFKLDASIEVLCNRGTNGIESSLPSAIGTAAVSDRLVFLLIGDLSFFYTVNALWNINHIKNLRILLINNGGGGIFRTLPKLNESASLEKYVVVNHTCNAEKWAEVAGLTYLKVDKVDDLNLSLNKFIDNEISDKILLEINFTNSSSNSL